MEGNIFGDAKSAEGSQLRVHCVDGVGFHSRLLMWGSRFFLWGSAFSCEIPLLWVYTAASLEA